MNSDYTHVKSLALSAFPTWDHVKHYWFPIVAYNCPVLLTLQNLSLQFVYLRGSDYVPYNMTLRLYA